jgi:hypothetical protein
MKKLTVLVSAFMLVAFVSNAQELKNKQGVPILPAAGDYAIGISATPIFNFFGNFVKINSGAAFNDPSSWSFIDGTNAIYGKYFVDANTAFRAKVRIGIGSVTEKAYVTQDATPSDPTVTVQDKHTKGGKNIVLGLGMEKRRGVSRLQGFYGAEAQISLSGGTDKYTYGNAFSSTYTSPGTTNFGSNWDGTNRVTEDKSGSTFGIGLRAFAGVEYFIMPKFSIGGEFGWGLLFSSTGDGQTTSEAWDAVHSTVKSTTTKRGGGGSFGFDTDNFNGTIYMMFHF